MNHFIENQSEDSMDAFPAEKYFDHYEHLNYIGSSYKDPGLAQRAEKVPDTATTNNARAGHIQKPKKKSNKETYPKHS